MQAASNELYTLAYPDFVTSIQYVQAIDINMFRIDTNCLVVVNMYVHSTENMLCDKFFTVAQTFQIHPH